MGSIFSSCCLCCQYCSDCCSEDNEQKSTKSPQKEMSSLKRASLMKKTVLGKTINPIIKRQMISRREQQIKKNESYEMQVLFSDPYNQFTKITSNLFLTGIGGINSENLKENQIKHIINVTYELPIYDVPGISSIRIPVDDDRSENLSVYFDEVSDKINKWTTKNENTVVHCLCGISRSCTLVLAYLMKYQNMNLKKSFLTVLEKRDFVHPNSAFFKQLIEFEKKIFRENSTKLIQTKTPKEELITIPDFGQQLSNFTESDGSIDSTYSNTNTLSLLSEESL